MSVASLLKKRIVTLSEKGSAGSIAYYVIKYNTAILLGKILGEEKYAKWFYHLYTGKRLNLEEPRYFDEKIWWLKLHNRDPLLTKCSDKLAVREYVRECGWEEILIPQIAVLHSTEEIHFEDYHEEVVIKCTHNSGGHLFYDPSNPEDERTLKLQKAQLKYILRHNASVLSREWNYKNIPPRLVVEKVIRDNNGTLPLDYKFLCFDGKPRLLFLDLGVIRTDRSYNHDYPRNVYDMEFHLLPVRETRPNAAYPVPKPKNFEKMVGIAEKLSSPFPFCRVDLYNVDGKIYFGEITFYHGGGCNHIEPEEWDLKIASWIDLNSPKIVRGGVNNTSFSESDTIPVLLIYVAFFLVSGRCV